MFDVANSNFGVGEALHGFFGTENSRFAGGDGTSEDPYQITTCQQLEAIGSDASLLSLHYILTSNIDCTATPSWHWLFAHRSAQYWVGAQSIIRYTDSMKVRRRNIGIIIIVIVVAAAAGYVAVMPKSQKMTKAAVITHSTDTPSEVKPGKDYTWTGGPQDPKKIIIPKLKVDGYVQQVGVDQNNQVAVPNNLYMVGWFNQTAQPGKPGLSVIDGHVTGRINDGIFKNLDQLKVGDQYTVEQGNGKKLTYEVISSQSVPVGQAVAVLFSQEPRVKSQLNLVTCSGKFDEKTRQYPDRLIVAAKLKS